MREYVNFFLNLYYVFLDVWCLCVMVVDYRNFLHRFFFFFYHRYNKTSVADGVAAVLNGNLDSFVYDGTVLDYLVAQDEDCRLLTVGSWYAMTGTKKVLLIKVQCYCETAFGLKIVLYRRLKYN